jgi:hypothetical protein
MRIVFHGLHFETPCVTFYLWSPWRAAMLEHRLFEVVQRLPRVQVEQGPDERRIHLNDPKAWRTVLQGVSRVLKGWQEEAEHGGERRTWRWLLEADSDADGYDAFGEAVSLWGFLHLSLERGGPGEPEKGEDVDLQGFGFRIWGAENAPRGD